MPIRTTLLLAMLLAAATPAAAQTEPAAQRGLVFVKTHCAACHAIGRSDESPLALALPLRDLHRHYAPEMLPEAMLAGVRKGHPNMPAFMLDVAHFADIIAYLKTFEK